jgi:uncharacterized protein (TIGR02421 family)
MGFLTENDILASLSKSEAFQGMISTDAFEIAFDPMHPYVCVAIHNGHRLENDLLAHCTLTSDQRYFEESVHTGDMVKGYPNHIICHDSRYEYDLNRSVHESIHQTLWGQKVWSRELPTDLQKRSHEKHAAFYRVYEALIARIIALHGTCVIYDFHSYNAERVGGAEAPYFNIGTGQIDMRKHRRSVQYFMRKLEEMPLNEEKIRVAHDEIFLGMGYLATRTNKISSKALCLPLEIKKGYCDEKTGAPYPKILSELKLGLTRAISDHAAFFINSHSGKGKVQRHDMLSSTLDPQVIKFDRDLYKISKTLETLLYVNPINMDQEKKKFFAHDGHYEPQFKYRKLQIDPFLVKESLYRLPIENISDLALQSLYRRAIDGLSTNVDLLASIGSKQCLYNSLRYFGEPEKVDIENARFLLHAPALQDGGDDEAMLDDMEISKAIEEEISYYKLDAPVQLSSRLVAGAMVDNTNFKVLIRKGNILSRKETDALKHHEIGIHLLTSAHAREQPLHLFRVGLPGSTETQEGIAVLSEYLSGNLSLNRLKVLGLRVMAVRYLLKGYSFSRTYDALVQDHLASPENAFTTTTRAYRGGGFTKDFLYLRGLATAYNHWKERKNWEPLLIGKCAFEDFNHIDELLQRGTLNKPKVLPRCFVQNVEKHPIHDYLLSSLKYEATGPKTLAE